MNLLKLKLKYPFFLLAFILLWGQSINLHAQIQVEWDASLGGDIWEELNSIEQTDDGGFIMAGFTSSSQNADVGGTNNGGGDYWVVKTDNLGNIQWENNFGGNQLERPWKVLPTPDGGYFVAGYSPSDISGDKSEDSRGGDDYWLIKIDNLGNLLWDKTYGGDGLDFCYDLIALNDGSYLLGGRSLSGVSGEKSEPNIGNWDYWLIKIDAGGNILWDKTIGGSDEDLLNEMQVAPDGNILIAGGTQSNISGDVNSNSIGDKDFWFIKVDANNGNLIWQRRYGGTDEDEIFSFVQTADGGYALGGGSRSNAFPPYKSEDNFGIVDMWVVKTDAAGNVQWDRTFGGTNLDNCYSLRQNSIGYFILSGFSNSDISGNKTTPTNGGHDFWIIYLDNNGIKQWERSLGGAQNDVLENAFQIDDGGYLLAGHSSSDVSGDKQDPSNGFNDFWIIKTVCDVVIDLPDTIVCPNVPLTLNAFDNTNCIACTWTWGDISTGDSIRTIISDITTTYSITLTDGVGCQGSDEITIEVIPTNIAVDLPENALLCNDETITLDAGNPGNSYQWSNGASTQMAEISTEALHFVTVTDANNCSFVDSTLVQIDTVVAIIEPQGSLELSCLNSSVVLTAINSQVTGGVATYSWEAINGGSINGNPNTQSIEANSAGTYILNLSNSATCMDSDSIEVLNSAVQPTVDIQVSGILNCTDTVVVLDASGSSNGPGYTLLWQGGALTGSNALSPTVTAPGVYTLIVTEDATTCTASQSVTVLSNYELPVVNTEPSYTIDCDSARVEMEVSIFPPGLDYIIQWTSENGDILSGENDSLAIAGSEGIYKVYVTHPISGCIDSTATTVLPNPNGPRSAWLSASSPICIGDLNGTMQVDSILGGIAPFEYSFNGEDFITDTFHLQLGAGENSIMIRDANACTWDTTIVLSEGKELLVDLVQPYGLVDLGDSIQLEAIPSEDIDSIFWDSPIPLSCEDCLYPWIFPLDDSVRIAVRLSTAEGCTNRDEIMVKVKKNRRVYIPNAFSPNGNRKNEFFSVFTAKEVKDILHLKIYNRWGGLIYEDKHLTLGDKKNGWNGLHKNERPALPGIYVYVVAVEFWDGEVMTYRGDFTLFR